MIQCIRQLANDMMQNINLNALVNMDIYAEDPRPLVKQMQKAREEFIQGTGASEEDLIDWKMIGPTLALPINVCGTVSNVLCSIFFDSEKHGYRFDFAKRDKEQGYYDKDTWLMLKAALGKRKEDSSYILRIDNTSHSYVLYITGSNDVAYLMQGNAGQTISQFTLQEWMNNPKSKRKLSLLEHFKVLTSILELQTVPKGKLMDALVTDFSIDDQYDEQYPFKPTHMTAVFRLLDEKVAMENLLSLYRRAGAKKPVWD